MKVRVELVTTRHALGGNWEVALFPHMLIYFNFVSNIAVMEINLYGG